jgi:VanZ family protein
VVRGSFVIDDMTARPRPTKNHAPRTANLVTAWAPVLVYMAGIFLVSAQSDARVPDGLSDKRLHFMAYAGLAILVFRALARQTPAPVSRATIAIAFIITATYAATDEIHQWFVPARMADVYDFLADVMGASVALLGCWAWSMIRSPKPQLPTSRSEP